MKRIGFFTLLFALTLFVGCGADPADPGTEGNPGGETNGNVTGEPKGTIGISVQNLTNPFFKLIADKVEEEAAKHGYETLKRDAQQKVANQNTQVKEFIVKGVAAIILCPADTKAIGPIIKEANEKGIPVFTIDTVCEDPEAKVVFHVGTNNFQGGEVAGQAMIDALGEAGGKIAILDFKDVDSCIDRVKGFTKAIDAHNETAANKIVVTGSYECLGDKAAGQNATRDAFNSTPDLVGIFAINDPAALGARAALEADGKADAVTIIGFDGQPEGKQGVKDGQLFDTPTQSPGKMAIESVAAMMKYFDGETVEPTMFILTESYRKEKADKDPSLK